MSTVPVAVPPTPIGNHCIGTYVDGTPDVEFRCVASVDTNNIPIYNCVGMRYFLVNCPTLNQQCSNISGAFVAAVTCCNQQLFN